MASEPFPTEPTFHIREQAAQIDSLLAGVCQALANAAKMGVEADKAREEAVKVRVEAKARDEAAGVRQEMRLAPWGILFTSLGAGAALFAAGAAFMKLVVG